MATSIERGREVRQRLLRAAAELIPELGWRAVSTRNLAERAGVAPGLVHYHFASLQTLLGEAAIGKMREMLGELGSLLGRVETAEEALAMLFGALDDYSGQDPTSLLFTEAFLAATRDEDLRGAVSGVVADTRRQLIPLLRDGGVAAPEATAAVLAAALDGVMLHRALDPDMTSAAVTPVLRRLLATEATEDLHAGKAGEDR